VYNRDVVLREVRGYSKFEVVETKKYLEKVRFELRNKEDVSYDSTESDEEVEQPMLVVKRYERVRKLVERYSAPIFCFTFVLIATNEEPKSVREAVKST
jgi:hypothetical protein